MECKEGKCCALGPLEGRILTRTPILDYQSSARSDLRHCKNWLLGELLFPVHLKKYSFS